MNKEMFKCHFLPAGSDFCPVRLGCFLEIAKFHQYNLPTVSIAESILLIEWPGFSTHNGRANFYG